MTFRCTALVPTYDNPDTVRDVVLRIRERLEDVLVIDDGSHAPAREVCAAIAREGLARVLRLDRNRGKGAAVKHGFAAARADGFTHAFQIDADGQHDLSEIPRFLEAARRSPESAIVAYPVYDETVDVLRNRARRFTQLWVDLEVGEKDLIRDGMIGFRVYPIEAALATRTRSNRMAFDVEIAVLLARRGVPIVNLPVGVRYLRAEEGGVSHFQPFRDNLHMTWMHTRLCTAGGTRWSLDRLGRVLGAASR